MTPLAERLRPTTLDNYIGQKHLVGEGAVLRNMIDSGRISSFILWGPPGVGKTQIMEQIARECEIGLVAYTITHHTRQSAVGLPFIEHKVYGGKEYSVTEYTMSEIVASIYEKIQESGLREGILFIDEINCVSETLAPAMLQFLQCKTFGTHKIPEGWIIVAAGNPPEYNKSVREFDVVTLDRIKKITVEPDLKVWKEYAYAQKYPSGRFILSGHPSPVFLPGRDHRGWKAVCYAQRLGRSVTAHYSL